MSRKARAGEPGRPFTIRITHAERAAWERAAKAEGCATLSAWIVKTANNRSARVLRGGKAR